MIAASFRQRLAGLSLAGLLLLAACGEPPSPTAVPAIPTSTSVPAASATSAPAASPTPSAAGTWQLVNPAVQDPSAALVSAPGGVVYAGGNGVYRSTDGGRTWTLLKTGFTVHDIAVARE